MNTREIGAKYEAKAAEWLERQGVKIVARNFRCRSGEIDLIGNHQGYLVFIEVKYRRSAKAGDPAEAVTATKQKKICRVADNYRNYKRINDDCPVRYDVIAIYDEDITWYQNAFDHVGRSY
jgi:putative endonuclease